MTRYCGQCGSAAGGGDAFCTACGRQLSAAGPAETPVPTPAAHDEALASLQTAVRHLQRHRPRDAAALLEQLRESHPGWAVATAYLGIAYLRLSRVADARETLEAAVALDPDSFICRSKYAEFLARLGFYDQAVRELDAALALHPPDAESRQAALELHQFAAQRCKGLVYRVPAYPKIPRPLARLIAPRRQAAHQTTRSA